MSRVHHLR